MPTKTEAAKKTPAAKNGTDPVSKPSDQALQVVDLAVGAVPYAADAVRRTVEQLRDPETRSKELETLQNQVKNLRDSNTRSAQVEKLRKGVTTEIERTEARGADVRRQVTDQVIEQARKARQRVEPTYKKRVEPVVKERVEPVYKQRVEPTYKKRVEPTVKRVRERI